MKWEAVRDLRQKRLTPGVISSRFNVKRRDDKRKEMQTIFSTFEKNKKIRK